MRVLLAILVVIAAVYGKPVSYEGYKVYGVTATTDEHYRMLVEWEKAGAYNFWTHASKHAVTDILVSPTEQPYFELTLRMAQMKYIVKINNLQELIDAETRKPSVEDNVKVSYEGYKVYGVTATTEEHYRMLVAWEMSGAYNFWTHASKHAVTDILVSPTEQPYFELTLRMAQMKYVVKINNLQELIDAETGKTYLKDNEVTSYQGYKLYAVFATTTAQLDVLIDWEMHGTYDFWTHPRKNAPTDMLIAPDEQASFESFLKKVDMDFYVKIEDVQTLIDAERRA